jgi:hypothetical protein
MTDKSLKVYIGDDRLPVQDLTDYVDWPDSRFIGQAYNGESSVSSVVFRDENARFGPWVDSPITIAVRNEVEVLHGSNFLYRGRWIGRTWERGVQKAYQAREVTAEAEDVNVELRGLIVDGWVRPVETDRARVLALREDYLDGSVRPGSNLATTYVSSSNTVTLPAKTYERTDPLGVLQDVAFQTHKQFFVTIDKELFYDGWDSGAYACPFRITDDEAELRTSPTTTLGIVPDSGPLFAINGQRFIDGIRLYYGAGSTDYVDVTHPGLSSAKAHWRETVYAPESITNATEAANLAETILQERSQDGRTFMLSVCHANGGPLTDAQVGSIKPGMLISIKARVLPFFFTSGQPNYAYYSTRIVSLQWHMPLPGQYFATLKLERPERTFGVGVKPGPQPPGEPTVASCTLDVGQMTAIATPNGDFELGTTANWTGAVLTAGDPAGVGGSWQSYVTSVGAAGWHYTWSENAVIGRTEVIRVFVASSGGLIRFGSIAVVGSGPPPAGDYTEFTVPSTTLGDWYCVEWTPTTAVDNVKVHIHQNGSGVLQTDNLARYTGGTGDVPADVGGSSDPGDNTGTYSPIDHIHGHGTHTADYHTNYVQENILTTGGDMPYATGASTWTRLGIGSSNFHLRSDGTKPVWSPEAGAALTNPMTTAGDIIKGGAAGTPERLAIGASNFHLRSDGTTPVWSPESSGLTNPMDAVGDLIRGGTAGAPTKLAIGASNFALKSTGAIPEWSNTLRLSYIDLEEHTPPNPPTPPTNVIRVYGSNSKGFYKNSGGTVVELGGAGGGGGSALTVKDEGSALSGDATTLDFVGAGVTATGAGATKTITIPGGGGDSPFYLDTIALHGTYGDEFDAADLDAKWTRLNVDADIDGGENGWFETPVAGTVPSGGRGYYQTPGTMPTYTEIIWAGASFSASSGGGSDLHGVGPFMATSGGAGMAACVSANGSTYFDLKAMTSGAWTVVPSALIVPVDLAGGGVRHWIRLIRAVIDGTTAFFGQLSIDGSTWTPQLSIVDTTAVTRIGFGHVRTGDANQRILKTNRFNVIAKTLGTNLARTPTSGTSTASASSSFAGFSPASAIDGNHATDWASNGYAAGQHWQTVWSVAQTVNTIVLHHRNTSDHWGYGYIEFSDGSRVMTGYMHFGRPFNLIRLPADKSTTLLKVVSTAGGNGNPGFFEVEAYNAT